MRGLGQGSRSSFRRKKGGPGRRHLEMCGVAACVIANVDGPDTLDQILLDLPIMKLNGQHVQVEVTPLRRFEDFAADVKKRLE